jgi:hypothetical protein
LEDFVRSFHIFLFTLLNTTLAFIIWLRVEGEEKMWYVERMVHVMEGWDFLHKRSFFFFPLFYASCAFCSRCICFVLERSSSISCVLVDYVWVVIIEVDLQETMDVCICLICKVEEPKVQRFVASYHFMVGKETIRRISRRRGNAYSLLGPIFL